MGIGSIISNILGGGTSSSNNVAFDFNTKMNDVNNHINNLSSISILEINNLNATSSTIFENLNNLSSQPFLLSDSTNLSSLNVSGHSTFNNIQFYYHH